MKSNKKQTTKTETIVIFGAHPDDEAIGPGGTIAKFAQENKRVVVVLFTQGEGSHPFHKKHIITTKRRKEATKCAELLGVAELHHWDYRDGKLTKDLQNPKVTQRIITLLQKERPTKIFTHARDDLLYPDHTAVHRAVINAVDIYNTKYTTQKVEVYTFNIWWLTFRNRNTPQLCVDITRTFHIKQQALDVFQSQKVALIQLWPTVIIKAIIHGLQKKTRFAENFYKIR